MIIFFIVALTYVSIIILNIHSFISINIGTLILNLIARILSECATANVDFFLRNG